ncbi:MAG: hypothetical protein ACYDCL_03970 [Myxococcales bacterium]
MRRRTTPKSRRGRRGQAMVEYSLMFWLICLVFIIGLSYGVPYTANGAAPSITGTDGTSYASANTSIFGLMIESYQVYQNGYYFSLCAPLP